MGEELNGFVGGAPRPTSAYGMPQMGSCPDYGWGGGSCAWGGPPAMPPMGGYGYAAPSKADGGGGKGGSKGGTDASNLNKVFIGGLTKETGDDSLREYFSQFGTLTDCVVIKDRETNRPRGFGFVAYENSESVDLVMESYDNHQIDGKWVEVKRATARDAAPASGMGMGMGMHMMPQMGMAMPSKGAPKGGYMAGPPAGGGGGGGGGGGINGGQHKVFVGGLSSETSDDALRMYFEQYGALVDCVVMKDKMTLRPRGFGFVQYDNPDSVEAVMADYASHNIDGKWVEVKRAAARAAGPGPSGPMPGYGPAGGYGPAMTMRQFRPMGPYGY